MTIGLELRNPTRWRQYYERHKLGHPPECCLEWQRKPIRDSQNERFAVEKRKFVLVRDLNPRLELRIRTAILTQDSNPKASERYSSWVRIPELDELFPQLRSVLSEKPVRVFLIALCKIRWMTTFPFHLLLLYVVPAASSAVTYPVTPQWAGSNWCITSWLELQAIECK